MAAAKTTERPLWRSPLPVLAAALACFLVVLALLTARVLSGHDPALGAIASRAVVVSRSGHRVVRTTASGRAIAGSAVEAPSTGTGLVTRSSVAARESERDG